MSQEITFKRVTESEKLLSQLVLLKAAKVIVSFDGSGDSGSIESVAVLNAAGDTIDIDGIKLEWDTTRSVFNHKQGQWDVITENKIVPLSDILEHITDDALEAADLDWYNNDGGFGELEIDLTANPPTVRLNVNIRVTNVEENNFTMAGLFKE